MFNGGEKGLLKQRPSSILFITYHFPPEVGGIQTRILNYVRHLLARKIHVSVIVVSSKRVQNSVTVKGARIVYVPGNTRNLFSNLLLATKEILTNRVEVLHLYTGSSTIYGALALLLARFFFLRTSASIFGREDIMVGSKVRRIISLFSLTITSSISTNSNATRMLLPPAMRKKAHVLYGGCEISNTNQSSPETPRILFVGRLVERKGVDDLIRAFAVVKDREPRACLVIVGNGAIKEKLINLAHELNLLDHIEFKGELEGKALKEEYRLCSLCVLPSKNVRSDVSSEGLGLALIEAAAHGKPLVGTDQGGIPEVIENGMNGIIVKQGDWKALSSAILYLIQNKEVAERFGRNAMKKAKELFSWEKVTERLLDSYC